MTNGTSKSLESSLDAYDKTDVSPRKKAAGYHRRNRSADLHLQGLLTVEDEGPSSTSKAAGEKGFKKSHRRMKSYETVTTLYNQSQSQEKENRLLSSGASSAESSFGESASVLREMQGSSGEFVLFQ